MQDTLRTSLCRSQPPDGMSPFGLGNEIRAITRYEISKLPLNRVMDTRVSRTSALQRVYSFGDFTLDLERGALQKCGADVRLRPKSFEMLCYLVENHGRLVSKDELLNAVSGH